MISGLEGAPSLSLRLLERQGGDFDFYASRLLPEPHEIKIPTLSQRTRECRTREEGWGTRIESGIQRDHEKTEGIVRRGVCSFKRSCLCAREAER